MSAHNRRIEAVIFDLDDTLLDWSQPAITWEEHLRPKVDNIYARLAAAGHSLPGGEEFFRLFQEHVRQSWEDAKLDWCLPSFASVLGRTLLGCGLDPQAIDLDDLQRIFDWQPMPGITPFADALPVLHELQRRGYKLGLITNSLFPMWMRDVELRAHRLLDYLSVRVASGDVGYLKPHPAIYEYALKLLGTSPGQAVFIGDRPLNDIVGASEVGLISVLVSLPHLDRPLDGAKPDYTIASLSELLPILEQLEEENDETGPE
jgi:FMN phosphatase YigB (HAD superfamily)